MAKVRTKKARETVRVLQSNRRLSRTEKVRSGRLSFFSRDSVNLPGVKDAKFGQNTQNTQNAHCRKSTQPQIDQPQIDSHKFTTHESNQPQIDRGPATRPATRQPATRPLNTAKSRRPVQNKRCRPALWLGCYWWPARLTHVHSSIIAMGQAGGEVSCQWVYGTFNNLLRSPGVGVSSSMLQGFLSISNICLPSNRFN